MKCFDSICTALVTPYNEKGIDIPTLDMLIKRQIAQGVNSILVCGTTGEGALLDKKEREQLISNTVHIADDKVRVMVGCADITPQGVIDKCRIAYRLGASTALVVTPYYQKTDSRGIESYYTQIADHSPLPIIMYNVPHRTGFDLSIDSAIALSTHDNIVGLKQAKSDIADTARLLPFLSEEFALYCGEDALCLPFDAIGARGIISVASNVYPRLIAEALLGNTTSYYDLVMLCKLLFCTVNPIPIKYVMYKLGLLPYYNMRSPLRTLNEQECSIIDEEIHQYDKYL